MRDRTAEGLGLLYAMHWPYYQCTTARGARRTALHDRIVAAGACMGETAGWERPMWYAGRGETPQHRYSYGRQYWHDACARECLATRDRVALYDQSSFTKYLVQGADACRVMNRLSTANMDVAPGRIVYTQWLNERGGIETDLTVTRLAEREYLVVTAALAQVRDLAWLRRHIGDTDRCAVTDITSGTAMLGIMGPSSRALLQKISGADLSNEAHPFAHSREIDFGYARVRASRITYVGELGYELYLPSEHLAEVYERLVDAGPAFGLMHAGYYAMGACRVEKGYRSWGHDIGDADTPLESGLQFTIAWGKPGGFVGREALAEQKAAGPLAKRLVQVALKDQSSAAPLLFHEEPLLRDGVLVGSIKSGAWGHRVGRSLGMGYVHCKEGVTHAWLASGKWSVEVAWAAHPVDVQLEAFYDPKNTRIRG